MNDGGLILDFAVGNVKTSRKERQTGFSGDEVIKLIPVSRIGFTVMILQHHQVRFLKTVGQFFIPYTGRE